MSWVGMNDDAVKNAGNKLQTEADKIQTLINKVDSEVEKIGQSWHGEDEKQFRSDWQTHKTELTKAKNLLTQMKQTIDTNVKQQESTSSQYN